MKRNVFPETLSNIGVLGNRSSFPKQQIFGVQSNVETRHALSLQFQTKTYASILTKL